ncbi:hypothetical protein ACYSNW_15880 [Enterococcus sp. LJL99]
MDSNQKFFEVMEQTLKALNEISQKLDGIERNTDDIDHQQESLKKSMFTLQNIMRNDNLIG